MVMRFVNSICIAVIIGVLGLARVEQAVADNVVEGNDVSTKTSTVTIQKKMNSGLLTKELRVVRINQGTSYFDPGGKGIDFASFAAPCRAVLVYTPVPKGDPEAVSITVKELLPGATRIIERVPE